MTLLQQLSGDLEALVARTAPAVVGLEHRQGQGSGLVLTPDGYLLTNAHVMGQRQKARVYLASGERLKGQLVGSDPTTDLAVLRVQADKLPSLPLATRAPAVGQVVIAMGNPLRLAGSVSLGVISALDRSLPTQGVLLEGLLQTDAAINPGNSGGPLVDAWGEVVGINTAIIPWAQGIGFAIPAQTAAWVAALLIQHGEVRRRYLGIAARGEALDPALAQQAGQPKAVRVLEVRPASPAASAGLVPGDLLLRMDGAALASVNDLQRGLVFAGDGEVRLELWRSGQRHALSIHPSFAQAA
jgi:serine protease Do